TDIAKELSLNSYQLGKLHSAFFTTYALFQLFVIAGWLVDRFHVGWVFAAGFTLWSGATAATGAVTTFSSFFALRFLLGAGESIAYPSYSKILANHFPEYHRGLGNAVIDAASKLGPAIGTLMGAYLMERYGWRPFFVFLGLASLLWLVPWIVFMPKHDRAAARIASADAPSVVDILRQRSAYVT